MLGPMFIFAWILMVPPNPPLPGRLVVRVELPFTFIVGDTIILLAVRSTRLTDMKLTVMLSIIIPKISTFDTPEVFKTLLKNVSLTTTIFDTPEVFNTELKYIALASAAFDTPEADNVLL